MCFITYYFYLTILVYNFHICSYVNESSSYKLHIYQQQL